MLRAGGPGEERSEDVIEIVKLGVFVVFGSLLTVDGLFDDGMAAVAIVAPLAVLCSVIAHGVSDTPGANWMARRVQREGRAG